MIDNELLKILACPACKSDVKLEEKKIVCVQCGRKYPIKDGIPIMLVDEAEQ
ncbi:MAG: Trm112 family protein [Candidatus Omnitrophota bacterium]